MAAAALIELAVVAGAGALRVGDGGPRSCIIGGGGGLDASKAEDGGGGAVRTDREMGTSNNEPRLAVRPAAPAAVVVAVAAAEDEPCTHEGRCSVDAAVGGRGGARTNPAVPVCGAS
jgi:hypothetical protein